MRADQDRTDRLRAVRDAGRAWLRAGWIDGEQLGAIDAAYPEERALPGPVFRILYFILILFAAAGVTVLIGAVFGERILGVAFFVAAALICIAAAEWSIARGIGVESAPSLLALLNAAAVPVVASNAQGSESILFMIWGVLCAAAAWRWGYWIYAGTAAVFLFAATRDLASARLIWIAAGAVLLLPLLAVAESEPVARRHRACAVAVIIVCAGALYVALNPYAVQHLPIGRRMAYVWILPLSAVLTAGVPALFLAYGIATRRRLMWTIGAVQAVASLVTLRWYVHVAPAWLVLLATGTAAIALAVALRRSLQSGPNRERHGFTAEPLLEDPEKRHVVEVAATLAQFGGRAAAAPEEPRYRGGGGEFGGGGASGSF
jgi:hypothetical protein